MEDLLPADLTIDILSRLPVKTVIQCKCVCKKWRNLVMDSSFVHLHHSRSPTGIIIHHEPHWKGPGVLEWVEIQDNDDYHHLHYDPLMSLDLNLAPILQNSEINLNGSVNGLICLRQSGPNIYICNPVTREYMIIPTQNSLRKGMEIVIYGFGMSSITGEYKVVRTFERSDKSSVSEAEVYTLGTGQWRSLGRVPYEFYGSYGSFLNDHCHWIVYDKADSREKLCTFDLDKETFQLFSSPPPYVEEGSEYHSKCLTILKGCLCIVDSEPLFTIWVMKEYGIKESWHKEVVINQAICPHLDWLLFEPLDVIEGLKDGSIMMLCNGKLWAFYPKNLTVQDTRLFQSSSFSSGLAYRPSFLKLQCFDFELERVNMF